MRGISFSAVSRFEKPSHATAHAQDELDLQLRESPSLSYSSSAAATPATNAAAKMMKKLSTTFRRKASVSAYHNQSQQQAHQQKQSSTGSSITTTTTTTGSSGRNTGEHALFSSMSSEGAGGIRAHLNTNDTGATTAVSTAAVDGQSTAARSSVPLAGSTRVTSSRAMTFSAPSRKPTLSHARSNRGASDSVNGQDSHGHSASSFPVALDIPFFTGDKRQPTPRAVNPALAVVRGPPNNENVLKSTLHRTSPSVSPSSPTPPSSSSPEDNDPLSDSRLSLPLPSPTIPVQQYLSPGGDDTGGIKSTAAPSVLREANYHSEEHNPPTLSYLTSPRPSSPDISRNYTNEVCINNTNTVATGSLPPLGGRHRYFSFDADTARKAGAAAALAPSRAHDVGPPPLVPAVGPTHRSRRGAHVQPMGNQQQASSNNNNTSLKQRHPRRRWLLPLSESPDKPRLFTPQTPAFARITRHRDRAEARTLASVCTFLEAEIDRMAAHVHTHSQCNNHSQQQHVYNHHHHQGLQHQQGNSQTSSFQQFCSSRRSHHNVHGNQVDGSQPINQNAIYVGSSVHCSAECANNCPLATYLPVAIERFRSLLGIVEERYDTIEQVYVKSEEYARAMGRFFNVTADQLEAASNGPSQESKKGSGNAKGRHGKERSSIERVMGHGGRDHRKSFR